MCDAAAAVGFERMLCHAENVRFKPNFTSVHKCAHTTVTLLRDHVALIYAPMHGQQAIELKCVIARVHMCAAWQRGDFECNKLAN